MLVRACIGLALLASCGGGYKQTMKQGDTTIVADKPLSQTLHSVFVVTEAATNALWDGQSVTATPFEVHDQVIAGVERAFTAASYQVVQRPTVLAAVQNSKAGAGDSEHFRFTCGIAKADGCVLLSNVDVKQTEFPCTDGGATKQLLKFSVSFDATIYGSSQWHARVDADSGVLAQQEMGVWGTGGEREQCSKLLAPAGWRDGHVGICAADNADACTAARGQVIEAAASAMIAKLEG
jgi:hypothetical protein